MVAIFSFKRLVELRRVKPDTMWGWGAETLSHCTLEQSYVVTHLSRLTKFLSKSRTFHSLAMPLRSFLSCAECL